jgi:hypothetical protein
MSDLGERQAIVEGPKATWAGGLTLFAGAVMVVMGVSEFLQGFSAVRRDGAWANAPQTAYSVDLGTWGWIHILIGVVAMVIGGAVLTTQSWGLVAGMVIAGLSAVANFLSMPQSAGSSLVLIGLNVALIWAFCEVKRELRALGPED